MGIHSAEWFVLFGASSNVGMRVAKRLLDDGLNVRLVARDPSRLDQRGECVVGDGGQAAKLTAGATTVISCAYSQVTPQIMSGLSASVKKVVLLGSAWRYSKVESTLRDAVVDAEAIFLGSGKNGVILHPTMIYGGAQERILQWMLGMIRRSPVLPIPGGGRHLIQPIFVDDVADSVSAAARRSWSDTHVIPLAGRAPMRFRDMVSCCMRAIGVRRPIITVPLKPVIAALSIAERAKLNLPVSSNMLRRFREDVNIPVDDMARELGVRPRPFEIGLREAIFEWDHEGWN